MGYFYKIAKSDLFVYSHDVKFSNTKTGDMHNYNYIKGPHGKQKITLPVQYSDGDLVKDVRIFYDEKQIKKILTGIEQYYRKTPYFIEVFSFIQMMFNRKYQLLAYFNSNVIYHICVKFGIPTEIVFSPGFNTKKNTRLIDMCKYFGADTYLSGTGSTAYINESEFKDNGIKLVYSDYSYDMVKYPQRYGEFIPNLSVLDWVFNMGFNLPEGWLSWKK